MQGKLRYPTEHQQPIQAAAVPISRTYDDRFPPKLRKFCVKSVTDRHHRIIIGFDWFQAAEVVHVEMDESDVTMVLRKLQDIETHIHRFTNGEKS